jgi:branched-chain amino acid transport system substrate-binding protein
MKENKIFKLAIIVFSVSLFLNVSLLNAEEPIRIGFLQPLTGPVALYGEKEYYGLTLALDDVGWNLHGRKIEVIKYDEECKPEKAVIGARKAISDKVDILLGPTCSNSAFAVEKIFKEAKLPFIVAALSPVLSGIGNEYLFRGFITDKAMCSSLVDYAVQNDKMDKIAIIHDTTAYGKGGGDAITARLKTYKLEPTVVVTMNPGDKDFSGQLMKIKESGTKALFIHTYEIPQALITKQARQLGLTVKLYGSGPSGSIVFMQTAGKENVEGFTFAHPVIYTDPDPLVQEVHRRLMKKFNSEICDVSGYGYDVGLMIIDAVKRAGPKFTKEALYNAMLKINIEGTQGRWDLSIDRYEPIKRSPIGKWENGIPVTIIDRNGKRLR